MTTNQSHEHGEPKIILVVAKKGNDFDMSMADTAIGKAQSLPPNANVALNIPTGDGFAFDARMFPDDDACNKRTLVESIFAAEENDETTYRFPLGYLNVHVVVPSGEHHCAVQTNLMGELRYLNGHRVVPLSENKTMFGCRPPATNDGTPAEPKSVNQPMPSVSNAIFGSRFHVVRPRQKTACRDKVLAMLNAFSDVKTESFPLGDYERTTEPVRELLYVIRLPDVDISVGKTQPWSLSRLRLFHGAIWRKLVELNNSLLVIRNGLEEGKKFPTSFAYVFGPKIAGSGKGGSVVFGEQTSKDGYVIDPKLFIQRSFELFGYDGTSVEHVYKCMETLLMTYGFHMTREDFGIGAPHGLPVPSSVSDAPRQARERAASPATNRHPAAPAQSSPTTTEPTKTRSKAAKYFSDKNDREDNGRSQEGDKQANGGRGRADNDKYPRGGRGGRGNRQ